MALQHSPRIVADSSLVLCLDAANKQSYPGSGTVWNDLAGSNNGTLTNGPTFSSANRGSIVFDGSNDYVNLARPSSIVTGGSISISLWAKWITVGTTTGSIQALIDNNHGGPPSTGFVIQDRPDLSKSLTFWSGASLSSGAISTFQVGDGTWRHIVGTNDQTTSRLYIDGNFNAQELQNGTGLVQPTVSIGYWQGLGGGRYLNGNISQVSIYNRALTPAEIQQNYNATKGRYNL